MDIMETRYYYFIMTLRTLTLNWLACFPASNLSFLLLLSPFHYRKKFICYCTFIKGHSYSRKISKSGSLWYCDCAQTDFEKCAMVYSQNSLWKLHARSCSKLLTNMVSTFSKFVFFFISFWNYFVCRLCQKKWCFAFLDRRLVNTVLLKTTLWYEWISL